MNGLVSPDSREYGRALVGQDVQQIEDARKQARDPNEQEETVIQEPACVPEEHEHGARNDGGKCFHEAVEEQVVVPAYGVTAA